MVGPLPSHPFDILYFLFTRNFILRGGIEFAPPASESRLGRWVNAASESCASSARYDPKPICCLPLTSYDICAIIVLIDTQSTNLVPIYGVHQCQTFTN